LVNKLEAGLSQLALEPEPNAPALQQVSAQVKDQLAVLQFALANATVDGGQGIASFADEIEAFR
jgi:hypothetical protein